MEECSEGAVIREANLTPWQPGVSGNPRGKKIGTRNRQTIMREWLEFAEDAGITNLDKIMAALVKKAAEGDVPAIKESLDSGFGKLTDSQDINMNAQVSEIKRTVVDPKHE